MVQIRGLNIRRISKCMLCYYVSSMKLDPHYVLQFKFVVIKIKKDEKNLINLSLD